MPPFPRRFDVVEFARLLHGQLQGAELWRAGRRPGRTEEWLGASGFVNGWAASGTFPPRILVDAWGFVHMSGAVTHAAGSGGNVTMFNVPAGYRSGRSEEFPCGMVFGATWAMTKVRVDSNGDVRHNTGHPSDPNAYTIFLSKILYRIAALD